MSTTVSDLIKGSLRLILSVPTGQSPEASEMADALSALNALIDSWSLDRLIIPSETRTTKVLTPGKSAYTLGSGGDINITLPIKIDRAGLIVSTSLYETPLGFLNDQQYAAYANKVVQTVPEAVYVTASYPLMTVNVLPPPNNTHTLVLYVWNQLSRVSLNSSLSLPPGYERALRYGLAVELAPEYQKSISPEIAETYNNAKAAIRKINEQPVTTSPDSGIVQRPAGWVDSRAFASGAFNY